MKVEKSPSKLSGEIAAPPSKSYLHRLIIAAFLCGKEIIIHTGELSEDARATLGAVKSLGGSVEFGKGFVKVCGGGEKGAHGGANDCRESANDPVEVDCGESGSTLRFLMPVAAALGVRARFTGKGRLSSRPIKALADCMNAFKQTVDGREILSPLPAGDYEIEGSESSQYITGMLFALSCLGGGSLTVTGKEVSRGYVEITIDVLKKFGVRIEREKNVFKIKSGFNACENEFFTEGDWSGAAFPLCAAAVCGEVSVTGLTSSSEQGDFAIIEILKSFGAETEFFGGDENGGDRRGGENGSDNGERKNGVRVKKRELNGIEVDLKDVPDLAQAIAAVAAFANGKTVLYSADRLRIKESDRIAAIINTLAAAGIKAEYSESRGGTITIEGGSPEGAAFSGGNDHRTVMSAAVIALGAAGGSEICGAEAAAKSYPEFFNDIIRLGGKVNVCI